MGLSCDSVCPAAHPAPTQGSPEPQAKRVRDPFEQGSILHPWEPGIAQALEIRQVWARQEYLTGRKTSLREPFPGFDSGLAPH